MKRLLGLLMAVMVMMGGMASSAETAQQEARKELLFKHQPDQIGIVTPLPDGRLFVESFVEDTETSAYHYIELFAQDGSLLCASASGFTNLAEPSTYRQTVLTADSIQYEYYRDLELDTNYTSVPDLVRGRFVSSELQTSNDAKKYYAENCMPFVWKQYPFTGNGKIPFSLTNVQTGKTVSGATEYGAHAICTDAAQHFYLIDVDGDTLQVRQYDAQCKLAQTLHFTDLPGTPGSAACDGTTLYLTLCAQETETLAVIDLPTDSVTRMAAMQYPAGITASSVLYAADDKLFAAGIAPDGTGCLWAVNPDGSCAETVSLPDETLWVAPQMQEGRVVALSRSADGRIWREEYQLAEAAQEIPLTESADDTNFYTYTDASGNTYDLFEIVKWQEDENHCVTAVTGRFERVVTDDDCETGEYANNGQTVTFPLAADFSAMMLSSMTDADMRMIPVTDLRAWYISAYLDGTAPESGEIVFAYDVSQEDAAFDFWFITVRIALNDAGEVAYMEYEYVPWG